MHKMIKGIWEAKGVIPMRLELRQLWAIQYGCWEPNSGPVEEQLAPLTFNYLSRPKWFSVISYILGLHKTAWKGLHKLKYKTNKFKHILKCCYYKRLTQNKSVEDNL